MFVFISVVVAGRNHFCLFYQSRCVYSRTGPGSSDSHLQTWSARQTTESGIVFYTKNSDTGTIIDVSILYLQAWQGKNLYDANLFDEIILLNISQLFLSLDAKICRSYYKSC